MKKYFLSLFYFFILTIIPYCEHIITEKIDFEQNNNKYNWKGRIVKNNGITLNNLSNDNFAVFYNRIIDFETITEPEPCAIAVLMDSSNSLKKISEKSL